MSREKYCGKQLYPHLFAPIRIGNLRLKNRIIAAPTSPSMITTDGHFTPEMNAYLEEKALGGAAVVTYGEAIPHSRTGKSHNKQLQLDSFGVKQMMKESTAAIHNAGGYANIQLSHGGMYGGLASVGGDIGCCEIAYGPSDMMMPAGPVKEMPKSLIYEIVDSYKKAAKLCKDCGYDMVMVHAAHGWLFSQFLSPVINQRKDEFGGSLENRARFLMMVLDAVREAVGPRFPIECRLSGDDMADNGLNQQDCIEVAKLIEDKVDLFNISCGNHEDPAMFCRTHPSSFFPRGVNVYLAAEIKKHTTKREWQLATQEHELQQLQQRTAAAERQLAEVNRQLTEAERQLESKKIAVEKLADDVQKHLEKPKKVSLLQRKEQSVADSITIQRWQYDAALSAAKGLKTLIEEAATADYHATLCKNLAEKEWKQAQQARTKAENLLQNREREVYRIAYDVMQQELRERTPLTERMQRFMKEHGVYEEFTQCEREYNIEQRERMREHAKNYEIEL